MWLACLCLELVPCSLLHFFLGGVPGCLVCVCVCLFVFFGGGRGERQTSPLRSVQPTIKKSHPHRRLRFPIVSHLLLSLSLSFSFLSSSLFFLFVFPYFLPCKILAGGGRTKGKRQRERRDTTKRTKHIKIETTHNIKYIYIHVCIYIYIYMVAPPHVNDSALAVF